jgi:hypothetical protein
MAEAFFLLTSAAKTGAKGKTCYVSRETNSKIPGRS